jgi:hypothetical protein
MDMKKTLLVLGCAALIAALAMPAAFGRAKKDVDLSGTWTGYTLLGDGTRADFNLILEKTETGYAGKINDDAGMMPEMPLKNVAFKDGMLTFDIDYPEGMDVVLIHIELKPEGDTMKGTWTDPYGGSNVIELQKKK